MIKVILFDCDGLIIRHEKYFSIRLAEQQGVLLEEENEQQKAFFSGVFLDCETGKADLKEELQKDFSIEEAKELPPSKFPKQKLNKKDREEKIKDIAKFLIAHGWKPNKKYWRSDKIDSLGFTEYGNG